MKRIRAPPPVDRRTACSGMSRYVVHRHARDVGIENTPIAGTGLNVSLVGEISLSIQRQREEVH